MTTIFPRLLIQRAIVVSMDLQLIERPQLQFDIMIEKVASMNRKAKKDIAGNHKDHHNYGKDSLERTLQDYFIPTIEVTDNTYHPLVETSSFELKPTLICTIQNAGQFRGLPTEDFLAQLKKFLYFANLVRINNVPIDVIRLRLLPFSLVDKALEWLAALLDGAITIWNNCTQNWRKHHNFSWKGQHKGQAQNIYKPPPMQHQNQGQRQEERRLSLQDTITLFMTKINGRLKSNGDSDHHLGHPHDPIGLGPTTTTPNRANPEG
ncbi:hypothetical protein CR513_12420, partial [Mucuna pruriens]